MDVIVWRGIKMTQQLNAKMVDIEITVKLHYYIYKIICNIS